MLIKLSNNLKDILRRDLPEKTTDDEIHHLIYSAMRFDNYITEPIDECEFIEDKEHYQGVKVNDNFIVYFTQILNNRFTTKGRNTFIAQNFYPVYNTSKKHNLDIKVSLNPISLSIMRENNKKTFEPTEPSIRTSMLEMDMLGVEFSNSLKIDRNIFQNNLASYLAIKNKTRSKNKKNDGMYISYNNLDTIDVYGTLEGAKWGDTFLSCALLKSKSYEWGIDNFNFIFYKEYSFRKKSQKLETLKELKYNIEDIPELIKRINIDKLVSKDKEEIKRNQNVFRRNIEKQYNFKIECFACDYNIKYNLVSSHVHRFADIIKAYKKDEISKDVAKKQVIDGLNGFLLCPNHDAEFEKGMIYFDLFNYKFKLNERNSNVIYHIRNNMINNINDRLKQKKIKLLNIHDNKKQFEFYVRKHQDRVKVFSDLI